MTINESFLLPTFPIVVYNIMESLKGAMHMSEHLLAQLEKKIENAIENIELLRLQVEELEEKNAKLQNENATLQNENATFKSRQSEWEQGLTKLLNKLDDVNGATAQTEKRKTEYLEEAVEALI